MLLIDDIQYIASSDSTQTEFFHTFDALYENHKQIIITSDRPPQELTILDERIRSRFEHETESIIKNHRVARADAPLPQELKPFETKLAGRSMIVLKAKPLAIECVVRGYLAGSGWKEYKKSQSVCGVALPPGLQESSELPEPIFTPSTKAEEGHDENISFEQAEKIVGADIARKVRDASIKLYSWARDHARKRGIIIADTKFEFGLLDGEVILIDEVLTPDSSRFWPMSEYQPGRGQSSFDKQFVRDYLENLGWNKQPPAPKLPADVVAKTAEKYAEAYRCLTGKEL